MFSAIAIVIKEFCETFKSDITIGVIYLYCGRTWVIWRRKRLRVFNRLYDLKYNQSGRVSLNSYIMKKVVAATRLRLWITSRIQDL